MCAASWQLDEEVAKFTVAGSEVSVDVTRPSQGLSWRPSTSGARAFNILGVALNGGEPIDAASVDAFVRGCDLVATYAERPPRHVRAQIYWRMLSPGEFAPSAALHVAAAFDLILSVNTGVLDEDPQSIVRSVVSPVVEILEVRADADHRLFAKPLRLAGSIAAARTGSADRRPTGCFIVRVAGSRLSYVEMVHPIDYHQSDAIAVASAPPRAQLTHHLFAQRLEKGVILRARVRAAFVERERDEVTAIAGFQHFAAAEPPLTV